MERRFIPLRKAVILVTGWEPHRSSCARWASTGVRGRVLPAKMINGRWMATLEDVKKFFAHDASNREATT